ncbi:diguanylate cyclase [Geobacter sulfurreducens]|uniref:diguanylate cyclase n=1 Tax=Geobacter sulfurreducens TaxID=35554 RepID=UPI000DBB5C74|nr:diguanylate cyclase [Geobacter sulfurreducens]BBA70063.1 putative diguanylate cyclase YdaM [Geobacter sulfurreducens]
MPRKKKTVEDPALTRALKVMEAGALPDADLAAEFAILTESYGKLLRKFNKTLVISDAYEAQHQAMAKKLEEATWKYRQLKDVALPICMYCKKIRSDDDYWQRLETFFCNHADIMFSHGICPDCIKTAYEKMGMNRRAMPLPDAAVAGQPAASPERQPVEDDVLREMRALVRRSAFDGSPVAPEVEQFVEKYGKLLRRFNKIVSISDSYQSQLRELNARLELMARTDLLTGLANHWEMVMRLAAEQSRSERNGKVFSIVLADIDHFKKVNDTHGHQAGDRVIRGIADTLRTNIRREDICSRWGGEEFLIILPEADLPRAGAVAAKLLAKVRNTVVPWDGRDIRVTVSIGYGTSEPGMSVDELIRRVDDALYSAKAAGRDRFAAAGSRADV